MQHNSCQRPYHVENTGSRLITAVKQHWAWLVLGWVTAWEHHVLLALIFFFFFPSHATFIISKVVRRAVMFAPNYAKIQMVYKC